MIGKQFKYLNSSGIYTVLFITNLDGNTEIHPPDVVYIDGNGKFWSTP